MTGIYDSHPLRILWFQNMLMELETSCCGMKYSLLTETQSKHQKQGQQSQNTRGMDGDSYKTSKPATHGKSTKPEETMVHGNNGLDRNAPIAADHHGT